MSGDVGSVVLGCLSQGVGPKQKKQDERGWYMSIGEDSSSKSNLLILGFVMSM